LPSFRVLPVEVGLFGTKEMEIVLLRMLVPLPNAAGEVADPVVWRFSFAIDVASWAPNVPIAFGVVF
jgi:hypothetical protein